ncbi:23S rRNA (uracil(1939)-C(5))-methyltransferase RlmD [Wukongibacter baidiensis]|uniref:23S rRNA (uracil(1939)-C(5))-methyltransferase RlmD n=1 Tax=Wukongibacter baidiensis TaxID=1723361 RepID=UPI003D7F2889
MRNYKKKNRKPKKNHQKGSPAGSGRVKANCIAMDEEGKGIIEINGKRVSVPYLIEGERAVVDLIKKRNYTTAKVHQIETKSKDRVESKCKHFYQCGGCQLQHMTYEAQSNYKEKLVEGLMGRYGKVNKIITMDQPYDYRNKIHSTLSQGKNREIISGIYEQYSHRVIPIDRCIIQDPRADEIIKSIRELMKSFKMRPFDEDTGQGFLRHILIKTGFTSGQIMVVLVVSKLIFPSKNNFVKALLKKHPEITTIVMNVNNRRTSVVLGNTEKVLYGKGFIEDTLCGQVFQISPKSFYQINPVQTEKLYNKAIEMAQLKESEVVFDAYSGIGTIALILSSKVKKVIGVEVNKDAVQDAIKNAKRNKIKNARFYQGDAGEFMAQMAEEKETVDTLFMDPPRSGSDEKFLSSIVKLSPKKVVYISCNPVTQARDLEYLTKNGYKVKEIQPVDMFPHTHHVETVSQLVKKK